MPVRGCRTLRPRSSLTSCASPLRKEKNPLPLKTPTKKLRGDTRRASALRGRWKPAPAPPQRKTRNATKRRGAIVPVAGSRCGKAHPAAWPGSARPRTAPSCVRAGSPQARRRALEAQRSEVRAPHIGSGSSQTVFGHAPERRERGRTRRRQTIPPGRPSGCCSLHRMRGTSVSARTRS